MTDQTGRMPRLIWVFAGRTDTLLVLSCRSSFYFESIQTCVFIFLKGLISMRLELAYDNYCQIILIKQCCFIVWEYCWAQKIEPRHDKTNKVSVRPTKTQISLGIRPVWSESSLSAWRNFGSLATYWTQAKALISLGGCPGWSESSLGAQPHSWFCHVAAH